MMTFTIVQRTVNGNQIASTINADSRAQAIADAEAVFDSFRSITYMALKDGIAHRTDSEFWSKSR